MLNLVLVAAMAVALRWCRRYPLGFLVAVNLLALPLSNGLTAVDKPTLVSTFVFVVPVWVVAVWEDDARSRIGLGLAIAFGAAEGLYWHEAGSVVANVLLTVALWFIGRVVHAQRTWRSSSSRPWHGSKRSSGTSRRSPWLPSAPPLVVGLHREVALTVEDMVRSTQLLLDALTVPDAGRWLRRRGPTR